jgi:histidine triad (HIT) family protein
MVKKFKHTMEENIMSSDTIFSKIIRKEIPADIVFQDDRLTAFRDINPQAPVHILIVPNKVIPTVNDVTLEDEALVGHMFVVAAEVAKQEGIADDGYRLLVNCGRHGHQEVLHLHMHLVGGKPLGRMVSKRVMA